MDGPQLSAERTSAKIAPVRSSLPWHHGIAGDKAFLLYILAGNAARAVPFLLFGAVALVWVLQ